MNDADTLLTMAEIAVAYAGFSGVVSAFFRDRDQEHPELQSFRLQQMVLGGLITVCFSLAPLVVEKFIAGEELIWRVSSALYALALAVMIAKALMDTSRFRREGLMGERALTAKLVTLLQSGALFLLLLNAVGISAKYAAGFYLSALMLGLGFSGVVFLRILSIVGPRRLAVNPSSARSNSRPSAG